MKFELENIPRNSSFDEVKKEIIRVANLITNKKITKKEFDSLSKISSSATRKFGNWEKLLFDCGLGERYSGIAVSEKMKVQSARGLSDSDLIEEINRVALQLDTKILSKSDFNNNSQFSATVICRRFGNWSNGLQLAGLKPKHQTYSELEYFENLLNVWTQYGRQPKHKEMDLSPSLISSGAYESKWGKWSSALQAFIEFVKKEKSEEGSKDEEKERPFIKIEENKIDKVETRSISVGLRYKILNRDRFRCVKCGRSPASDLTCEIHIDHILPFSKGGRTIFENLQTTCKECNLGKSNNYVH